MQPGAPKLENTPVVETLLPDISRFEPNKTDFNCKHFLSELPTFIVCCLQEDTQYDFQEAGITFFGNRNWDSSYFSSGVRESGDSFWEAGLTLTENVCQIHVELHSMCLILCVCVCNGGHRWGKFTPIFCKKMILKLVSKCRESSESCSKPKQRLPFEKIFPEKLSCNCQDFHYEGRPNWIVRIVPRQGKNVFALRLF